MISDFDFGFGENYTRYRHSGTLKSAFRLPISLKSEFENPGSELLKICYPGMYPAYIIADIQHYTGKNVKY